MKGNKTKLLSLLLTLAALACLLSCLSGAASAAEAVISVGAEWTDGDILIVPEGVYANGGAYIVVDMDAYENPDVYWFYEWDDYVSCLEPDRYTVTGLENKSSSATGNGYCRLEWTWHNIDLAEDIYVPHGGRAEEPLALRIVSGSGTDDDPYVPDFVYPAGNGFTVLFNSGTQGYGTMNPVTDVSGAYVLPACGFYAMSGYSFSGWKVNNTGALLQPGDTIQVTANLTLYAQWAAVDCTLTVTNGTASFNGVTGSTLTGLHIGDVVTVTAAAAPAGQVFDQWNTDWGGSFGNRYEATTTFTMPGGSTSIWVRYKAAVETCSHHDGEIVCYAWDGTTPLPNVAGHWFLTEDVTLTSTWEPPQGTTTLCLHNHTITMAGDGPAIRVGSGASLFLTANNQVWNDMNNLRHAENASGCGVLVDGGDFRLEVARIRFNDGGGVTVNSGSAVFDYRCAVMENGGDDALGGGLTVNGGSVVFDGGYITGNTGSRGGVYVNGGVFTVGNGNLYENPPVGVRAADGELRIRDYPTLDTVYLERGQKIHVVAKLKNTSSYPIGVAMEDGAGVFTNALGSYANTNQFVRLDERFSIVQNATGEAVLIPDISKPYLCLPASLTAIEESAFEGSADTAFVSAQSSLSSIGRNAFKDCPELIVMQLPKNCAIDDDAFSGSTDLRTVIAPAGGTTEAWCQANNVAFLSAEALG